MPDILIYAGTNDAAMRHEVPIGIPDPFLYIECAQGRHVVLTSFEIDRVNEIAGGPTPHAYEEFGMDELLAQGLSREEVYIRIAIAAVKHFGSQVRAHACASSLKACSPGGSWPTPRSIAWPP